MAQLRVQLQLRVRVVVGPSDHGFEVLGEASAAAEAGDGVAGGAQNG